MYSFENFDTRAFSQVLAEGRNVKMLEYLMGLDEAVLSELAALVALRDLISPQLYSPVYGGAWGGKGS